MRLESLMIWNDESVVFALFTAYIEALLTFLQITPALTISDWLRVFGNRRTCLTQCQLLPPPTTLAPTPTFLLCNLRAPYRFFDGFYTDLPSIGNILRAHAGHDGLCDGVYTQAAAANSRFT